jgi:hypothetical protein
MLYVLVNSQEFVVSHLWDLTQQFSDRRHCETNYQ